MRFIATPTADSTLDFQERAISLRPLVDTPVKCQILNVLKIRPIHLPPNPIDAVQRGEEIEAMKIYRHSSACWRGSKPC